MQSSGRCVKAASQAELRSQDQEEHPGEVHQRQAAAQQKLGGEVVQCLQEPNESIEPLRGASRPNDEEAGGPIKRPTQSAEHRQNVQRQP